VAVDEAAATVVDGVVDEEEHRLEVQRDRPSGRRRRISLT
jgi:hypothetical protein